MSNYQLLSTRQLLAGEKYSKASCLKNHKFFEYICYMSEYRKANVEGATYFVTLTVVGWIDVFTREIYTQEIIKNLQFCQKNKGLEVFAYVIMSNHIHLVARRKEGLLSNVLRDFKSYTSKQILKLIEENPSESRKEWLLYMFKYFAKFKNQDYMFWQHNNHPIELVSANVTLQKINYIHENPVRAGIVSEAQNYIYSSANQFSPLKCIMP